MQWFEKNHRKVCSLIKWPSSITKTSEVVVKICLRNVHQFTNRQFIYITITYQNQNDPDVPTNDIYSQQDGRTTRWRDNLFSWNNFQSVGRQKLISLLPRSPDSTCLNFILWGHLENKLYINRSDTVDELIREEVQNLIPDVISKQLIINGYTDSQINI